MVERNDWMHFMQLAQEFTVSDQELAITPGPEIRAYLLRSIRPY